MVSSFLPILPACTGEHLSDGPSWLIWRRRELGSNISSSIGSSGEGLVDSGSTLGTTEPELMSMIPKIGS